MQTETHIQQVRATVASSAAAAQSRLAASWCRSMRHHGLDPGTARAPVRLSQTELGARAEGFERTARIAAPKLDHLFSLVRGSGCGVVLTDADGIVMEHRHADAEAATFKGWGLARGADWSEAREGTNGIGTCLYETRPVVIHREEHFLARNIEMSCIGAPVFGPDGEIVAALQVTAARSDRSGTLNRLFAAMTVQIANQIEADLFRAAFPSARIVVANAAGAETIALLAVDGDDLVIGANREARRLHGLDRAGALRPRPTVDLLGGQGPVTGFENAERSAVVRALARAEGNVSAAARALGVSRVTLYRRMKRLGLMAAEGC